MKPNFCKVQTSHSKQRPSSSPKRPFIEWQQPFLFSEVRKLKNVTNMHSFSREKKGAFYVRYLYLDFFFRLCLNALLTSFVTRCLRVWTLILPWTQTRARVWIMPNHQVWIAIVNGKSNPNPTQQQNKPTRNYLSSRTTKDDNDIYKSIIKPFILLTFFFGFLSSPSKNTFQIFWAAAKLFLSTYGQTKEQATLNVNFNGDFKFSLRENYCNMRDGESFPW